MKEISTGLTGWGGFGTIQTSPAGFLTAQARPVFRPATTSDENHGMTPAQMGQIIIIALLLIGPYINLMFPLQVTASGWAAREAAAASQSAPPEAAPAVTSGSLNAPSQIVPSTSSDCVYNPADTNPPTDANPLRGVFGRLFNYNGAAFNDASLDVTITVRDAAPPYNVRAFKTLPSNIAGGVGFKFTAPAVPSGEELIIEASAVGFATTYFNYLANGGTPSLSGRYTQSVASKIFFNDSGATLIPGAPACTAYVVLPNPLPANYPIDVSQTILVGGRRLVTMTNSTVAGNGIFNIALPVGRALGGRAFLYDGTTNPPPFYTTNINLATAKLYTFTTILGVPTLGATPIANGTLDREGYYIMGYIPDTIFGAGILPNGNYALKFEGTNLQTNYFCNYPPGAGAPSVSQIVPITLGSDTFARYVLVQTQIPPAAGEDARVQGNNCRQPSGNLSIPGLHNVFKPLVAITGTIKSAVDNSDVIGAYAVAYIAGTNTVAAISNLIAVDAPTYSIEGLQPGTNYNIKFVAPTNGDIDNPIELISEWYNNLTLDTAVGARGIVATPGGGGVVQNVNALLDTGWYFSGSATLSGLTPSNQFFEVTVYRTTDLATQTNPTPVDRVFVSGATNYTTHKVLMPGESYKLVFRPFGSASTYIAGWCKDWTGGNCANPPGADSGDAFAFVPNSAGLIPRQMTANIVLFQGVVFKGTIFAQDSVGSAVSLGTFGTSVSVYVYRMNGSTPVLTQLFNVPVNALAASYPYTTSALLTNNNYIIRFVPFTNPGDPGFIPAYYKDPAGSTGSPDAAGATQLSSPSIGPVGGKDITLVRAGGITVTLTDYQGFLFNNVRTEVFFASQYSAGAGITGSPIAVGVTDANGKAVIPGLAAGTNQYILRFTSQGSRGSTYYTTTLGTIIPPAQVSVVSGQWTNIAFQMPPFAGVGGAVNDFANPGINWDGTQLLVINGADFSVVGTFPDTDNGTFRIYDGGGGNWQWDAFLPKGSYYFALIPANPNYVTHYRTDTAKAGCTVGKEADPNCAQLIFLDPTLPNYGYGIELRQGGVVRVYVIDQLTGLPASPAATVGYYATQAARDAGTPLAPGQITGTTSIVRGPGLALTGTTFSFPYNGILWFKAAASPSSQSDDAVAGPLTVGLGQTKYITITLPPTPFITGTVKKRGYVAGNPNQEAPVPNVQVAVVDANTDAILGGGAAVTTTDSLGRYSLRLPKGASFKLKFITDSTTGLGIRYWTDTPQATGTITRELAVTLNTQVGKNFVNYNLVYDLAQPNANTCRITDLYVQDAAPSSATIKYFTNCLGTTQAGWTTGDPDPLRQAPGDYPFTGVVPGDAGGVYTHTISMTGLTAGMNYNVRVFSQMPISTGPIVASEIELQVRTSTPGTDWYFAAGNIAATSGTISTTEVLHLFNYNNSPTTVFINYYTTVVGNYTTAPGSAPFTTAGIVLAANQRLDIPVNSTASPYSLASLAPGYNGSHATHVTSSAGIVVEKSQTLNALLNGTPYNGGYSIPGASAPNRSWYFPEITLKANQEHWVSIYNTSDTSPACVDLTYYYNGTQENKNLEGLIPNIPAKTVYRFRVQGGSVTNGPTATSGDFGLKVGTVPGTGCNSNRDSIVVEMETRMIEPSFAFQSKGVAGMLGIQHQSQRWYFLDGQTDKPYEVRYTILNPQASSATVTVTAYIDNPTTGNISILQQFAYTVAAGKSISYTVPMTLNQSASGQRFGFTARVDSTQGVIAQRSVRYLYSSAAAMDGLYHEAGVTRASSQWLFAAGDTTNNPSTQNYTEETINLYNSNPVTTTLNITYYFTSGAPVITTLVLGAYERFNLKPDITPGSGPAGYPSVGPNKVMAVKIKTAGGESGIFAERLIYWRKGGLNGGNAVYGWIPPGS